MVTWPYQEKGISVGKSSSLFFVFMKNIRFFLGILALLVVSISASAYDAKIGNIYYNLNHSTKQAEVVEGVLRGYTGDIVIPENIYYNGTDYSVTAIAPTAFYQSSLTSIVIPNSITSIGAGAFYDCSGLTSVTIPNSVTSIGAGAFRGCSGLTTVIMSDKVSSIPERAFSYCEKLSSINIPNAIISIGNNAFEQCRSLTSISFPSSLNSIGEGAFNYCGLSELDLPNSITSIGSHAFSNSSLTRVTISSGLNSIPDYAFSTCIELSSVSIPEGVKSIGINAFYQCPIRSITIPSSIMSIGKTAFFCPAYWAMEITCLAIVPPTILSDTFDDTNRGKLHVVPGCKTVYEATENWKEFTIVEDAPITITLGSNDYATYCSDVNLDFSEVEGLKAYIASSYNPGTGSLTITRVDNVPAGEGMLLKGTAGESYDVPTTDNASVVANLMKGNTTSITLDPTTGEYTNFVLSQNSEGVMGFYRFNNSITMPAHKAWLQIPTSAIGSGSPAQARGFRFVEEGDEMTGIADIEENTANGDVIYDLQGRRLNSQPARGLYIQNGKKIIK